MSMIDSDKSLIIGLSAFSLLILGAGIYSKLTSSKESDNQKSKDNHMSAAQLKKQQQDIANELNALSELQMQLVAKAQDITIEYIDENKHILTIECIKNIFDYTSQMADKQELNSIFQTNRRARRSVFATLFDSKPIQFNLQSTTNSKDFTEINSMDIYYRFVCTFEEEIQYLIEKAQKDFLIFLNIDYSMITNSIEYHFQNSDDDFKVWTKEWSLQIKDLLKQKLIKFESQVDKEKIAQVLQYQYDQMQKDRQSIEQAVSILNITSEEQRQSLQSFLACYLQDITYIKFNIQVEQIGITQEDLTPKMQECMTNIARLQSEILASLSNIIVTNSNQLDKSDYY